MHADLIEVGWTEDHWNRITTTVAEEAQAGRIAARVLPVVGPEDPTAVAVPRLRLGTTPPNAGANPTCRLRVDTDPDLHLTTIAINVELRTVDVADPALKAALVMFRRAANQIARIEDALIFNGRRQTDLPPAVGLAGVAPIFTVHGRGPVEGIFEPAPPPRRNYTTVPASAGSPIFKAVVAAISALEGRAQLGPYACILGHDLFEDACDPTGSLVLPRDRILPFLEGPLVRSSAVRRNWGTVIALNGQAIEIVVASDIGVRYLQTTVDPRFVFRVSERIALRVKDPEAIQLLRK